MSKITNIGVERELTGERLKEKEEYERERDCREEKRMIDIKVSSCSETERRNRMLLKAAFR